MNAIRFSPIPSIDVVKERIAGLLNLYASNVSCSCYLRIYPSDLVVRSLVEQGICVEIRFFGKTLMIRATKFLVSYFFKNVFV